MTRLAALALGAALTLPAAAHHSVVQYDLSATARKTLTGTVKKFEWQNPHSWIWMEVPQTGAAVPWGMELSSPGALRRSGFAWDSVKVGEKITVEYAPIKDGRNAGLLIKLTYEDGRVWQPTGQASPLPPPGREAPGAAPPPPEAPADAK